MFLNLELWATNPFSQLNETSFIASLLAGFAIGRYWAPDGRWKLGSVITTISGALIGGALLLSDPGYCPYDLSESLICRRITLGGLGGLSGGALAWARVASKRRFRRN